MAVRDRYPTAANEPRAVYTAKDKYITGRDDVPAIEYPRPPVLTIVRVSSSAGRIRKKKKKKNILIMLIPRMRCDAGHEVHTIWKSSMEYPKGM